MSFSLFTGLKKTFSEILSPTYGVANTGQDVVIKFLSAQGLPKMDFFGSADPYFIAKIDDQITFNSTILTNTLSPKWDDEEWIVRNIPITAKLSVSIYDKDDDAINDDHIGRFEIADFTKYQAPSEGHSIVATNGRHEGYFHLTIESTPSPESSEKLPRYTFDGPCRYIRHNSAAVGRLTKRNAECIHSTFTIQLRRIPVYFRPFDRQPWNRNYGIAQAIFGGTPHAIVKQETFKLAHKMLYGSSTKNDQNGRIRDADDLWDLIFYNEKLQRIKPCIYTYIIDDDSWRFSETGVGFFTDYASKHALHANCSEYVRYAGQFHPRPRYGWDQCDDEWELVMDNWSGTYAPSLTLLSNLKELFEFNFPGLNVVTYDFKDPLLKESMEQLKLGEENSKKSTMCLKHMVPNPAMLKKN